MLTMRDVVALTVSAALTVIATGTIRLFGGQIVFGDAPIASTVGAVVSTTVTWNVPVVKLPCASVARQLTSVVPSANTAPLGGEQTGSRSPSTPSWAVAVYVTAAPPVVLPSIVMSDGRFSVGGTVSMSGVLK